VNDEAVDAIVDYSRGLFNAGEDQRQTNEQNLHNMFQEMDTKQMQAFVYNNDYVPELQEKLESGAEMSERERNLAEGQKMFVNTALMKKREEAMLPIMEDLNSKTTDMRPWHQFDDSIALLEFARDAGYISDHFAMKQLKNLEKKQLALELKRNPDQFWNPNTGKFYSKDKFKNVKYLDQEEYEQAARTIK
jgi:hypothetical protein